MRQSKRSYHQILLWIRERELGGIVASLLEGLEPLSPLGAQVAYLLVPLAGSAASSMAEFGGMLEDPAALSKFISCLREETERK